MPLPLLAAILPLLPMLAPLGVRIADWLGGEDAEQVAQQVSNVVTAVAGSTDPATVAAVLQDPSRAAEITMGLARIAADREKAKEEAFTARMVAQLSDTASARNQTVALAHKGSRLAWMPAIITFVLLGVFGFVLWFVFTGNIPETNTRMADQLIGGLYTLVTTSVSYWVGTSRGAVEMRQGLETSVRGTEAAAAVATVVRDTITADRVAARETDTTGAPRRLFGGPRA